ncbi:DUF1642 domain-containing protein [Enterococcus avium]|uniref:DUF1642 domain-containing protein n=1 Tax=Enterococcus avium TaxID=33945 RepID=UPI00159E029E|nr:DUF1642 domain-containing protein [Enterococcus avium]NVN79637.1 DUF1642 domain-containing protein [Enterococcus avium]
MNKQEALEELDETGKQFFQAASNVEIESNSRSIATGVVSGLGIAKSVVAQIDEPREASWQDAIQFLEDHFGCEIPRNLDQVIEGFKSMSGLMNSVEFELDKRGSKLTSKEFVLEALERYKQKVKVPAFVAEKMKRYKTALWMLSSEYFDTSSEADSDELANWIDQNSEKFFRAWLDGYEVEEEPKWVVKVGNLYFCGWEDTTAQFVMNTVLGEDESIIKYKNEGTASSVAKNLGGTVEKV